MMIKIFPVLVISVLLIPVALCAQEQSKVEEAFSPEEIAQLKNSDPNKLEYLQFKANECYSVQDLSGKKDISNQPDVSELNDLLIRDTIERVSADDFTADNFNPLLFNFGKDAKMAYFRIGETGKLLKIYSEERCRSLFNERK